jgi:hypothetical protein
MISMTHWANVKLRKSPWRFASFLVTLVQLHVGARVNLRGYVRACMILDMQPNRFSGMCVHVHSRMYMHVYALASRWVGVCVRACERVSV